MHASSISSSWIIRDRAVITFGGTATAVLGFVLVMAAAAIVVVEGTIVARQLDEEMLDGPNLAQDANRNPGQRKRS